MIQKTPLVPLASLTKATRVKVDTPGKCPDPGSIRYGGKTPKGERTDPPVAVPPVAVPPVAVPPAAEPVAPPPVASPSASTAKTIASTAKTTVPATQTTVPATQTTVPATQTTVPATQTVPIPINAPIPVSLPISPKRPPGLTAWPLTRAALDNAPLPSRRSLASRYDLFPYGPGLLPDPGPPTGPEHWGLDYPPPGGPVLVLVGQYGSRPRRGTAPLLSVSFACNFGLREPRRSDSGRSEFGSPFSVGGPFSIGSPSSSGGPFSVGVMLPTGTAPYRPDLGQLMGFALREAAVPPERFQPGRTGAAPETLTLLLHFLEPGGEPLRRLFGPPLPGRPLPGCLVVRVPDLAGGTHKVPARVYDAGRLARPHSLADAQCLLAIDRGRGAAGDMSLVSDLVSDPAALLRRDPERYGRAAAQQARLLIMGRRPYEIPAAP